MSLLHRTLSYTKEVSQQLAERMQLHPCVGCHCIDSSPTIHTYRSATQNHNLLVVLDRLWAIVDGTLVSKRALELHQN